MNNILTTVKKVNEQNHHSPFIIHTLSGMYHIADFQTQKQLNAFLDTIGVKVASPLNSRK